MYSYGFRAVRTVSLAQDLEINRDSDESSNTGLPAMQEPAPPAEQADTAGHAQHTEDIQQETKPIEAEPVLSLETIPQSQDKINEASAADATDLSCNNSTHLDIFINFINEGVERAELIRDLRRFVGSMRSKIPELEDEIICSRIDNKAIMIENEGLKGCIVANRGKIEGLLKEHDRQLGVILQTSNGLMAKDGKK